MLLVLPAPGVGDKKPISPSSSSARACALADEDTAGVAVLPGHTAYRPRLEDSKSLTRPGNPPEVLTWADADGLTRHRAEINALGKACDVLTTSQHWGLDTKILAYQREIAHAAIDAGADLVFGHGPHHTLPIEFYRDKAIFYGTGSFSFETGHCAQRHPDWLGMMVEDRQIADLHFQFVRHNAANETIARTAADEADSLADLRARSATLNAELHTDGERVHVQVPPSNNAALAKLALSSIIQAQQFAKDCGVVLTQGWPQPIDGTGR
jgi:poly-gamma-glutamate capsule biosynthesis protein CapA/YwtB (metallophosphatase superfamily)